MQKREKTMRKLRTVSFRPLISLFLGYLCWETHPLAAKDFGIQGHLFSIEEENLMTVLQKKFSQKLSSLDLQELLKKMGENAKHPLPSINLTEAAEYRLFHYDPSYIAQETITDNHGTIIIPKGTKINPLQTVHLKDGLLFLDGDNPKHIAWARKEKGSFKWILVRGNPLALEEKEKRPIFFDQRGISISKLHLHHIPARVTQDGLVLKVEEIPLLEEITQ